MRNQAYHYSEVGVVMSADTGEHVWVSPVPKNAEHRYFKLYDDLQYPEKTRAVMENMRDVGYPSTSIDEKYLPDKLFATKDELDIPPPLDLPPADLFTVDYSVNMVTERCAEVLRQFDLGSNAILKPCDLYATDKVTLLPDKYYLFYFDNRKDAFSFEHSVHYRVQYPMHPSHKKTHHLKPSMKDDVISVTSGAQSGADIWCDKNLHKALFVSDALAQALKSAGVAKDWHLYRAPVVQA